MIENCPLCKENLEGIAETAKAQDDPLMFWVAEAGPCPCPHDEADIDEEIRRRRETLSEGALGTLQRKFGAEAVVRALGAEYIGGVLLPYEMITCTASNPNPEAEDHEGAYQADFGANECYVCRDCGARWGPNE